MSDALHTGADRFQDLMRTIACISDATCDRPVESGDDSRDYRAIVEAIDASLGANLARGDAGVREGYLRALANLLCLAADGCAPSADEDPLLVTAAAFLPAAGSVEGDLHV